MTVNNGFDYLITDIATTAGGIHELLQELKEQWRVTPIVVTHNLTLANKMERCFHLVGGKLEERAAAAPESTLASPPSQNEEAEAVDGASDDTDGSDESKD